MINRCPSNPEAQRLFASVNPEHDVGSEAGEFVERSVTLDAQSPNPVSIGGGTEKPFLGG